MVREYFCDVDVLRCVDEEAPPENIEEDEEDGRAETGDVGGVEKLGGERAQENDAGGAARGTD